MNIKSIKAFVSDNLSEEEILYGEEIFKNNDCTILSQSAVSVDFMIYFSNYDTFLEYKFIFDGDNIAPECENERIGWNRYSFACLLQLEHEINLSKPDDSSREHKKYSRQGMIKRVMDERRIKANKAKYRITWASNIYGDHILTNEKGISYKVFLRDFENETGYSDSMDSRLNKLGTTKHIMYAFNELKSNEELFRRLDHQYPFIEIYCDPLNDYKITRFYPAQLPERESLLLEKYFGNSTVIEDSKVTSLLGFIDEVAKYPFIRIRPEVKEKIERSFEKMMLEDIKKDYKADFSAIKASLFPYQKEGVNFVLFRKSAIIADEMGLGKTLQAISAAILKKDIFGFKKTLIVCPATLKSQWKKEIERFSSEKAHIVNGYPADREKQYKSDKSYFLIVNYEMVRRDSLAIQHAGIDFLILDEAQKIKNYETKTSGAIKRLKPSHTLVITGTPIENRLIDIYSIMSVIDPHFFGPLWEFSYHHCLFDTERIDKINGYYNLQELNKKLSEILIRREKRNVIDELPNVQQIDIPAELSPLQRDFHASYASAMSRILSKKFLTPYDLQRLQQYLTSMRMVCDSTFLIDDTTNESPKMEILKDILFEKLDIKNTDRKIIIFSEWIKVHKLIGQLLRENNIGFVELTGKVPVALRGELIKKFENQPECKIFLSTEAGGAGLNLQVADILINFELPWNPAKKNQRIGRIDRLGQKSEKLTIYNFVTRDSIEQRIATGLLIKQNLFEGVLDSGSNTNYVDFSNKGRSQFIQQLEDFLNNEETEDKDNQEVEEKEEEIASTIEEEKPVSKNKEIIRELDLFENINDSDDDDKQEEELEDDSFEQETTYESPKTTEEDTTIKEEEEDIRKQAISQSNDSQQPDTQTSLRSTDEHQASRPQPKAEEMEQVMNNGMQFLAGLFKMSTGKDMGIENQSIEIDKETGEVTMKFKMKF
jgi:SNF2 family DNA or RNA helicase